MNLLAKLWRDEAGVLLSAEAVVVGTVAVVGLTTGLTVVAKAVNEELQDVAFAIRSLDQSYSIPAIEGCGARTAGSSFQQEPVKESLAELTTVIEKAEKEEKTQAERLKQQMKKKDKNGEDSKKKKKREENI
jgi:hypothetical protein